MGARAILRRFIAALAASLAGSVLAAPALAADSRTLHVAFPIAEAGLDPQVASDIYSLDLCAAIFEPLYAYDYFARPVRLVPNTAASLPEISPDGRTYVVRVRPGIYFADDPAFKGRRRELTADDYVYSIKRILDPKVRSYWLYVFEKRLVGLDAVLDAARKSGALDYSVPIEGLQALDRYTLRIRFRDPEFGFQHWLTTTSLAAVAREVVEAYGDASRRVMENPVGTGAYRLVEWRRSQRLVLEANPAFREQAYPAPGGAAEDAAIAKGLSGRRLPLTPRVEIAIIEEAQPRLLAFQSGAVDYLEVPTSIARNVLDDGQLTPAFKAKGVVLHRLVEPSIAFTFFNMDDPTLGGYTPDKIALRRAIAMVYDRKTVVDVLSNGQALPATQVVPPSVPGYDPAFSTANRYDPAAARALLDRFGYKDRDGDGYREMPDGRPLAIVKGSTTDASSRAADELWKKNLDAIGLRISFIKQKWPELNKMSEAGQLPMWNLGWISSTPDPENFYSPLYSANIGLSNDARLRLPEYDRLYEASRKLPDGAARNALYRKMNELIDAYAPWIVGSYSYNNTVQQPWLRGFKLNPYVRNQWKYYAVDPH